MVVSIIQILRSHKRCFSIEAFHSKHAFARAHLQNTGRMLAPSSAPVVWAIIEVDKVHLAKMLFNANNQTVVGANAADAAQMRRKCGADAARKTVLLSTVKLNILRG